MPHFPGRGPGVGRAQPAQWFRYAIGAVEVAGAVGMLIPRLARYAALGLVVLMAGAVVTKLFVLHDSPLSALPLLVTAVVVVAVRRPRPRGVPG